MYVDVIAVFLIFKQFTAFVYS